MWEVCIGQTQTWHISYLHSISLHSDFQPTHVKEGQKMCTKEKRDMDFVKFIQFLLQSPLVVTKQPFSFCSHIQNSFFHFPKVLSSHCIQLQVQYLLVMQNSPLNPNVAPLEIITPVNPNQHISIPYSKTIHILYLQKKSKDKTTTIKVSIQNILKSDWGKDL